MRTLVTALALAALAAPLAGQDFLDRGTFIITRGGAETAREEFAIRSTAGRGGGLLAVSTTRGEGREIQHALELTADFTPVSFQQTESAGGRVVRRVSAQLAGVRFSARVASADGETAREFPVRPPVVILGDAQACAFYFVPRSSEARTLHVIRPEALRPVSATVSAQGSDTVTVAGRTLEARRYVLRAADGDERHFWFSPRGDLLRVAHPAQDLVATRADLPSR
jgi:hypothetical protein